MAGTHCRCAGEPYDFPQTAAHPVTLDGTPDLFGDCETDADRPLVGALARLQDEGCGRRLLSAGCGQEVGPLPQSLHRARNSGTQTLAAARTTCREHPSATCSSHARTKAMTAFAHKLAGLIGPLHGSFSASTPLSHQLPASVQKFRREQSALIFKAFYPKTGLQKGCRPKGHGAYKGAGPCSSMRAGCLEGRVERHRDAVKCPRRRPGNGGFPCACSRHVHEHFPVMLQQYNPVTLALRISGIRSLRGGLRAFIARRA